MTRLVETRNSRCTLTPGSFSLLAKCFKGSSRQVGARKPDRSERGQCELGKVDIVKPNHREIVRDPQSSHVGGAQHADGGHVVGANDGGGPLFRSFATFEARHAAAQGVIALDDPGLLDGQPCCLHGGAEVVLARDGRVDGVRPGEKADLAVAEPREVVYRGAACRSCSPAGWCWSWDRPA